MAFTGYRVYRRREAAGGSRYELLSEPAGPSVELTGIAPDEGGGVAVQVRPVLDGRESPLVSCGRSLVLDETGDWPGPAPPPVEGLHAWPREDGVRVAWVQPVSDGSIDRFEVRGGLAPHPADQALLAILPSGGPGWYIRDMSEAEVRYVSVTAETAAGRRSACRRAGPLPAQPPPAGEAEVLLTVS